MRNLGTAAVLALAATLSACAGGPNNPGLSSINQPVVSRTDYVFDIAAGDAGLGYGEEARLADWFETLELGYGDRVSIDDPNPYGAAERRADVAEIAGRYGLLLANRAPVTAGQIASGTMRVVISRMEASVPNCPNWDRKSFGDFTSSTTSNYGCATNQNMAIMVADPEDLVRGQTADGSGDPRTTARAVGVYRNATPSGTGGLEEVNTQEGN